MRKVLGLLSVLYVITNGTPIQYEGMTQVDIINLYAQTKTSFAFVDVPTYQAAVAQAVGNPVTFPSQTAIADQAILKNPLSTTDQKVNALIQILGYQ